jgi:mono/diheme cytochrome c family protein
MRGFLIGLLLGLIALPAAGFLYLRYGKPPVAVTDPQLPFEKQIVHVPLNARIDRENAGPSPVGLSDTNLLLGAEVYRQQCAACHGLYGRDSAYAAHMFPPAPQLWHPHGHGVVGVSDDPPSETYWKVKNGIRLSGMPAYASILSETQMWQVSVLLANADKPQPAAVLDLLKQPLVAESGKIAVPDGSASLP